MPTPTTSPRSDPLTWDAVRSLVGSLPNVEESTSYGTPALKVAGKLFARKHQDGENLVVPMPRPVRARKMADRPDVFHLTDHYSNFDYVLVRLAAVTHEELAEILYAAWRVAAPKSVLKVFDNG